MSAKAIYEYYGKALLYRHLPTDELVRAPAPAHLTADGDWATLCAENPWIEQAEARIQF